MIKGSVRVVRLEELEVYLWRKVIRARKNVSINAVGWDGWDYDGWSVYGKDTENMFVFLY